jgi:hypothetical protein
MTTLPEPVHPRDLRISDADRERVAGLLRVAASEGRLDLAELDERLGAVYAARTRGDIEPLTGDLMLTGSPAVSNEWAKEHIAATTSRTGIAVMSGFERKGRLRLLGRGSVRRKPPRGAKKRKDLRADED